MNTEKRITDFISSFPFFFDFLKRFLSPEALLSSEILDLGTFKNQGQDVVVENQNGIYGLGYVVPSVFDTAHLGMKTAQIKRLFARNRQDKQKLVSAILLYCRKSSFEYVTARIPTDFEWIQILEENGFRTIDTILYLTAPVNDGVRFRKMHTTVQVATDADGPDIIAIAKHSFGFGRYYQDPIIPRSRADALYATWAEHSTTKKNCDEIFVSKNDTGQITGFVSVKKVHPETPGGVGFIDLLAVGAPYRRSGVSQDLLAKAEEYFRMNKLSAMVVDTQMNNIPALRTYLTAGFVPEKTFTTLRVHL